MPYVQNVDVLLNSGIYCIPHFRPYGVRKQYYFFLVQKKKLQGILRRLLIAGQEILSVDQEYFKIIQDVQTCDVKLHNDSLNAVEKDSSPHKGYD